MKDASTVQTLNSPQTERTTYLKHIAGLRGLAIIAIILFHLQPDSFPNGYLGVDVFLLISGYFLFRNPISKDFTLKQYLLKKVTRIMPPAIAMIFVTVTAALLLFPYDLSTISAKTALYALLGASNEYLSNAASNYFADSARENPFTHTWYLSVILQCYLLYALYACCARRLSPSTRIAILAITGLASFSIAHPFFVYKITGWEMISKYSSHPELLYYLTTSHLWVVIAGGLVHNLPDIRSEKLCNLLFLSGILVLAALMFSPGKHHIWDNSAIALSGTLVIAYAPKNRLVAILGNRLMAGCGNISYSLYLWHWPVIVFASYYLMRDCNWSEAMCIAAGFLSLAILGYRYTETTPFKKWGIAAGWIGTLAISGIIWGSNGFPQYIHASVNKMRPPLFTDTRPVKTGPLLGNCPDFCMIPHPAGYIQESDHYRKDERFFQIGDSSIPPNFILLGDSHAEALYPGLDIVGRKEGWSGIYVHSYVMPFWDYHYPCLVDYQLWTQDKAEQLLEYLAKHSEIKSVFLAQRWHVRLSDDHTDWQFVPPTGIQKEERACQAFETFVHKLIQRGKKVYVFADIPESSCTPRYLRQCMITSHRAEESVMRFSPSQYDQQNGYFNSFINSLQDKKIITVLHPEEIIFQHGNAMHNGHMLMIDRDHLSQYGSIFVIERMKEKLKRELASE